MQNQLLTVFSVAQLLNRSPSTVRKYEAEGKLKALRTSAGERLFRRGEVERFMTKRKAENESNEVGPEGPRPAA